jgi:uncharacterized protein
VTADHQELAPPPRWGIPDAALCFFAGLVTSALAVGIASAGAESETLAVVAAGLIGSWVGIVASVVWVSRTKGTGSLLVDFGLRFERGRDLIGVAIGVATQIVVVPLLYLPLLPLIDDLSDRVGEPARELSDQVGGDAGLAVLAVLVIVGAPIVEELLYRGLLLRALARRVSTNIAIGVSAAVFALTHFQPIQFPALLVFGVILGVLATRTGRLGPGILAHAAFNAVTMAVLIATR